MKKICDKIISNGRQILEIIILILVTSIPWIVDLKDIFKDYLSTHPISPDDFFWQVALRNGNIIASIVLFFAVLYNPISKSARNLLQVSHAKNMGIGIRSCLSGRPP